MYDFREVIIGRGEQEHKRLVIEFSKPNDAILGEFLMTDVTMLAGEILQEVEEVIRGERSSIVGSGNRCGWKINRDVAIINDLFEDMDEDVPVLPTCTIETTQLYELLKMWMARRKTYYET